MSTENRTRGQKRVYFAKQKACLGKAGFGTCMDCMRLTPQIALPCSNMGEYMPKREWNRIFANSPLYNKDLRARDVFVEEMNPDRPVSFSSTGKPLNRFGLPMGKNGI